MAYFPRNMRSIERGCKLLADILVALLLMVFAVVFFGPLGGLLGFLNQLYYRTAAVFELIPAWLRFLESRHLIDAALRVQALRDMESLIDPLCQVCNTFADIPTLHQALLRWRVDAA